MVHLRPTVGGVYAAPVIEQTAGPAWLTPSPAVRLGGDECFVGLDATVADLWRWAFSDLRDNTSRGVLAEFLIAKAVNDRRALRIGWDNFDATVAGHARWLARPGGHRRADGAVQPGLAAARGCRPAG